MDDLYKKPLLSQAPQVGLLTQPEMPQLAPPAVQEQQAPPVAPAYQPATLIDPTQIYANHTGQLSAPDPQKQLYNAWQGTLNKVAEGDAKRDRGTRVIYGALSALGGLLGGGYAQGGMQLLNQAQTEINHARAESRMRQQDSLKSLTTLTNIMQATDPNSMKNLGEQVKAATKFNDQQNASNKNQLSNIKNMNFMEVANKREQRLTNHGQAMEALKQAGIDADYAKMQQLRDITNAKMKFEAMLAQYKEDQKNGRATADRELELRKMAGDYMKWNAAAKQMQDRINAQLVMQGAKTNANGDLIYKGVEVPQLSGAGIDIDLSDLSETGAFDKANSIVSQLQAPELQPMQKPEPVIQPGNQIAKNVPPQKLAALQNYYRTASQGGPQQAMQARMSIINTLVSKAGMSPEEALSYLKTQGFN